MTNSVKDATDDTNADSELQRLLPRLSTIGDHATRRLVERVWRRALKLSDWKRVEDVVLNPALGIRDGPEPRLIPHVNFVTEAALQVAKVLVEQRGLKVDEDLLIAGCLLHDVSKLVEYTPTNGRPGLSDLGRLAPHGFYGAHLAAGEGADMRLVHLILAHTHQMPTPPQSSEALILHYVDYLDADLIRLERGLPTYAKRLSAMLFPVTGDQLSSKQR